ncbi:MAG TPA: NotI family restriction endonuclease [Anaerolineae bacterium]|nr:NotI family restriction endonuclease [Anaerolineae bacterium]HOQ97328.1 NotI family restriction endonuclease [Anaerolineae bacterium]HOQ97341.1 NotI family restriction endonuclease [Anaerolineae bacterium]HPL27305.1 NotI family restriction endonuclease [Anaerolineae bacterium]
MAAREQRDQRRFGIGEWYGKLFTELTGDERKSYADLQQLPKKVRPDQPCPFQSAATNVVPRNKEGGVCTLRLYTRSRAGGEAGIVEGDDGDLRTVCPKRFEQDGTIYAWVGQVLLGCDMPQVVREVGFLSAVSAKGDPEEPSADVGRIDEVLIVPDVDPLRWCALEIQAAYFQGDAMSREYHAMREHSQSALPFPSGNRRPDYRSSGPKRLMPQLQTKVPSLRRWGKKMAVVVDRAFFAALAPMAEVSHVSNCDIAWFVVRYDENAGLVPDKVFLTTLEQAVEGITAGAPVSLEVLEERIRAKLAQLSPRP